MALPNGRFVKDQTWPRREISEVGERFIRIRHEPGGEANVLPIPIEILPMVDVLGLLVGGRIADAGISFEVGYDADATGWHVTLTPRDRAAALGIRLVGCGERLRSIEIEERGGIERIYFLGPG